MLRRLQTRRATVAALGAAFVATGAGGAWAQLDEAVQTRTRGNQANIKSQEKVDSLAVETDKMLAEYRSVMSQVEALRVYNRQLQQLVDAQESEASSIQRQIDDVQLVGRAITPLMLKMIESLARFVELDVPFLKKERSERVAFLREIMTRSDVTDAERFRRILEAYQIENDYGRAFDAYRGELQVDGTAREVDFLTVGRIALIYQTLDGAESGVWDQANRKWVAVGGEYRLPIRKALRMARKQAAPDLIELPIATSRAAS